MIARPIPVSATVVMRCALFGLAKIGARIHAYSENAGLIVARVGRYKVGSKELMEEEITVSVKGYEGTSLLTITASEKRSLELLNLISTYVMEGEKAIRSDAQRQRVELLKQEEAQRKRAERHERLKGSIRNIVNKIPLLRSTDKTLPAPEDQSGAIQISDSKEGQICQPVSPSAILTSESGAIVLIEPAMLQIGEREVGMLLKDREGNLYEIQIDPLMCDRASYLTRCFHCSTINLRGSDYCSKCGKPLAIGAAVEEVKREVLKENRKGYRLALMGLVPALLGLVLWIVRFAPSEVVLIPIIGQVLFFVKKTILSSGGMLSFRILNLALFAIPALVLGLSAVSRFQRALLYSMFNFYAIRSGRGATIGRFLGYFDTYTGVVLLALEILDWMVLKRGLS